MLQSDQNSILVVRKYRPSDKDTLDLWWMAHHMPPIPGTSLPAAGYLVQGVAAGFLYKTDSDVALIENFISNPVSPWADRQAALDGVTLALLQYAKDEGFRYVMALTTSQAIHDRATRLGFKAAGPFHVLNMDLHESSILRVS